MNPRERAQRVSHAAGRPYRTSAAQSRMHDALRRWAVLLDSQFRVPGTRFRFGLDAILGLIPGLGDITTPAFSAMLLVQAVRMRLPFVVQALMVANAALDMLLGLVPIVGDLVDIGWKANLRNLRRS